MPINKILVFPADRIKAAMGIFFNRYQLLYQQYHPAKLHSSYKRIAPLPYPLSIHG